MDLDGFAFCAGLQKLSTSHNVLSLHPVTHLIKRATFRSVNMMGSSGRASLGIFQLGQLLDLYHEYEASKRHDKIYALMGMSSDDLESSGLSPDYEIPWHNLLARVIHHLLGSQVGIDTWPDREVAMIRGQGFIIGEIVSIVKSHDTEGYRTITFRDTAYMISKLTIMTSAKPIRKSDIICRFEGALNAMIVRPCQDHFATIAINIPLATSSSHERDIDLIVVWNWETSISQNRVEYAYIDEAIGEDDLKCELAGPSTKDIRQWKIIEIMWYLEQYKEIIERLLVLANEYQAVSQGNHARLSDVNEMLLIAYFRTEQWEALETFVQQKRDTGDMQQAVMLLNTLRYKPSRLSTTVGHPPLAMPQWEVTISILDQKHTGLTIEMLQKIVVIEEEVFLVFLDRIGKSFHLSGDMLLGALSAFDPSGVEEVKMANLEALLTFLDEGNAEITEEVLALAAKQTTCAVKLMRLFLKRKPDVQITETVVVAAANNMNIPQRLKLLEYLLRERPNAQITSRTLEAIVCDYRPDIKTLRLVLKRRPDIPVSERTLLATGLVWRSRIVGAENDASVVAWYAEKKDQIAEVLLEHDPEARITEEGLDKVARYEESDGYRAIQFFIKHKLVEAEVGEKYLARARARRRPDGPARPADPYVLPTFLTEYEAILS
jgi:hypothetical protein